MRKIGQIQWFIGVVALLCACTTRDGECHDDKNVLLGCELYSPVYNSTQEVYQQQKLTAPFTVAGVGCDSTLYDHVVTSKIFLPLNKFDTTCSFIIQRDSLRVDTLTLHYNNSNSFMSLECGSRIEHDIIGFDFTAAEIDSITLLESHINNSQSIQMRLYFHNNE